MSDKVKTPTRVQNAEMLSMLNALHLISSPERAKYASGSLLADLVGSVTFASIYSAGWQVKLLFLVQEPIQKSTLPLLWDIYEELILSSGGGAIRDAKTDDEKVTAVIGQVSARAIGALVIWERNGQLPPSGQMWKDFFSLGALSLKRAMVNKALIYKKLTEMYGTAIFPEDHKHNLWGVESISKVSTSGFKGCINIDSKWLIYHNPGLVMAPSHPPDLSKENYASLFVTHNHTYDVVRSGLKYHLGPFYVSFENHNIEVGNKDSDLSEVLYAGRKRRVNPMSLTGEPIGSRVVGKLHPPVRPSSEESRSSQGSSSGAGTDAAEPPKTTKG